VVIGVLVSRLPFFHPRPHPFAGHAGFTADMRPGQSWTWKQFIQNTGKITVTMESYEPVVHGPVRVTSVTFAIPTGQQSGVYLGKCSGNPISGFRLGPGRGGYIQVRVQAVGIGKFNIPGGTLTFDGGSLFFVGSQAGTVRASAPMNS
jgi:hypothetical protein